MALPRFTVYILVSVCDPSRHYTGITELPVDERLRYHNGRQVPHTAKFVPWRLETYVVFRDGGKARAFERYLKSGSGREFARRHF